MISFSAYEALHAHGRVAVADMRRNEKERNGTMKERLICIGGYMLAAALSLLLLVAVAELSMRDTVPCATLEW